MTPLYSILLSSPVLLPCPHKQIRGRVHFIACAPGTENPSYDIAASTWVMTTCRGVARSKYVRWTDMASVSL